MWHKWIVALPLLGWLFLWPLGSSQTQEQRVIEEYIFVPKQDFKAVLGDEPKGVQISYEKYQDLLKRQPAEDRKPAAQVMVRKVDYRAQLVEKSLHVQMDMYITSISAELEEFVFQFGEWGVEKATLDGKDAHILARETAVQRVMESQQNRLDQQRAVQQDQRGLQQMVQQIQRNFVPNIQQQNAPQVVAAPQRSVQYRLFVSGAGEHKLTLVCHQTLQSRRDELLARLVLGRFPQQTFRLETQADTEYFTDPPYLQLEGSNELVVYLGDKSEIDFRCRPREKQDVKQPVVLVHGYASHLVHVDKISSVFHMVLDVRHRPQKTFELLLPLDVEVVHISEKRWEIQEQKEEKRKRLTIQLDKEVVGTHAVSIKAEQQLLGDASFTLPAALAVGNNLLRQDGLVYVEKSSEIRLALDQVKEVRQVSPHTLFPREERYYKSKAPVRPAANNLTTFNEEPFLGFQYWNPQYEIRLTKKVVLPSVESTSVAAVSLYPDGLENVTHVSFDILEGKVKQLELGLPQGWNLSRVETYLSRVGQGFQRLPQVSYYVKGGVLYLPLPEKVSQGEKVKTSVTMQTVPDRWNSSWRECSLPLPLLRPLKTKYLPSFMGIIADPDYQVGLGKAQDIASVDLNIIRNLKIVSNNLRLGLKITSLDASGNLDVTRKTPYTSVVAATYLAVQPEKLRCSTVLAFDIKNASRDSFEFQLSPAFQQLLHITDEFGWIKEKRYQLTDKGFHQWNIQLQKRVLGSYSLYLSFDVPLDSIKKQGNRFRLPGLSVSDIEQMKGFLGIAGSSQAEITMPTLKELEHEGLDAISIAQLPILAHPEFPLGTDFLHAFKYTRANFQLDMSIRVHDKVEVASAIIEDSQIVTLIPESGMERVTCTYRLSHLGLQFFSLTLPQGADFWSAVVDDQGEKPLRQGDLISIPVPQRADRQWSSIKVVYQRKVAPLAKFGTIELDRPQVDANIPLKKLSWQVYLPKNYQFGREFRYLGASDRPWYVQLGQACFVLFTFGGHLGRADTSTRYKNVQSYESVPQSPSPSVAPTLPVEPQRQVANELRRADRAPRPMPKPAVTYSRREALAGKDSSIAEKKKAKADMPGKKPMAAQEEAPSDISVADKSADFEEEADERSKEEEARPEQEEAQQADDAKVSAEAPSVRDQMNAPVQMQPQSPKGQIDNIEGGEWGNKENKPEPIPEKPQEPLKPAELLSKLGQSKVGLDKAKAMGLRSLDVNLDFQETRAGSKAVSPSLSALRVAYVHDDARRSLLLTLLGLFTMLGMVLLGQHKLPRARTIAIALLTLTFVPHWFGLGLTVYCNFVVWGILLSCLLALTYKAMWKVGGWLRLHAAVLLPLVCLVCAGNVMAQERNYNNDDNPPAVLVAPAPPAVTPADQPKVHRIFVPYNLEGWDRLPQIQDVFIPYSRYLELWNKAYPKQPVEPVVQEKRPDFLVYHAAYQGRIVDKEAHVRAQFFVLVTRTPVVVPLGLKATAIQEAFLETAAGVRQPLTLQPAENGYSLIIKEPGEYKVDIDFLPDGDATRKQGNFRFGIVPVATSVFRIALDADVEVEMDNFRGQWFEKVSDQEKTVTLFPGNNEQIAMKWYQSSEWHRAQGLNIATDSSHVLELKDNVLSLKSKLRYQVLSGNCSKLTLRLPLDYTIVSLKCTNLEQWILSRAASHNEVVLRLVDNSQRDIQLEFVAEKLVSALPGSELFPDVVPLDATRENGLANLVSHNSYKVFVTGHKNLWKVGSQEAGENFIESFRFNDHPHQLTFQIAWRQLNNFAHSSLSVRLSEEEAWLNYQSEIEVKEAQIFACELTCPADFEIIAVEGERVKTWRAENAGKEQRIHILFASSIQQGEKVELQLSARKDFGDNQPLAIPYFVSPQISYQSGTILVASAEDLDISPEKLQGLEEYDISQFADIPGYVKRYGLHYEGEPYQAVFQVQRRKPEKQVDVAVNLLVEDDWLNFGYFLNYRIQFAGVDTFHFRLPYTLGENIEVLGENIREIARNRIKDKDDQKEYWVYKVSLHNKVRNAYSLAIFPEVKRNNGTGITVEPIHFPQNTQLQLCVLIQNASQYVLNPQKVDGVTPIDAASATFLPPKTEPGDFILAYKMGRLDWQLTFTEQKQRPEYIALARIVSTQVDSVVDESGECRHRLFYQLKPGGLQFLELAGMKDCKIWGVFVGGYFIRPVRRADKDVGERVLIPLYPSSPVQPEGHQLGVRMIYSQKLPAVSVKEVLRLAIPKVCNVQEVGKVTWNLTLPDGFLYKFGGDISMQEVSSYYRSYQSYPVESKVSYVTKGAQDNNIKSALSNTNRLQQRQGEWWKEQQETQRQIWEKVQNERQRVRRNVQDMKKQQLWGNEDLNELKKIEQYGLRNLQEAERAAQNNDVDIYRDRKSEVMAGEAPEAFQNRQADEARKMIAREDALRQQAISYFNYDLETPAVGKHYTGTKPGAAFVEIRCYTDPRLSKFWLTLQFLGFLALIWLSAMWQLFTRKGYTLKKFGITVAFILIAIFLCYLRHVVHYFYL